MARLSLLLIQVHIREAVIKKRLQVRERPGWYLPATSMHTAVEVVC